MSKRLIAAAAAFLIVAPTVVLAANSYTTPSSLFAAIAQEKTAQDFSYELHGRYEQYYVSAWMKGAAEGTSADDLKATVKTTMDVAEQGAGKIRIRMQMRIVNGTVYLLVEKVEGTGENDWGTFAANLQGKKWIMVPLEQEQQAVWSDITQEQLAFLDELFTLQSRASKNGTTYTLNLKRDVVKMLQQTLRDAAKNPTVQAYLGNTNIAPKVRGTVKIETNTLGKVLSTKIYGFLSHAKTSLVVQGTSSLRTEPVQVTAPSNIMTLEELQGGASSIPLDDASDTSAPVAPYGYDEFGRPNYLWAPVSGGDRTYTSETACEIAERKNCTYLPY